MTVSPGRLEDGPLAVWLIGVRGAVATTTVLGTAALRLGHTRAIDLVTEVAPLALFFNSSVNSEVHNLADQCAPLCRHVLAA